MPNEPNGADSHGDEKEIDGPFSRNAIGKVHFSTTPDEDGYSCSALMAQGDGAEVHVQGQKMVYLVGGALQGYQPPGAGKHGAGVMALCLDNRFDTIRLQLGYPEDPVSMGISIQHNGIIIDSGSIGFIHLHSGPAGAGSSIHMTPEGIKIKGPIIEIN